jgi:predicted nucleic acid-binding Zn ribbon protein
LSRRPRQLGSVLGQVQARLAPAGLLPGVQREWRQAVGEAIAAEAWPESERAGTVTVRCRSAVWAAELSMLAESLVEQLNRRLPEGRRVVALKFSAGPSRDSGRGRS